MENLHGFLLTDRLIPESVLDGVREFIEVDYDVVHLVFGFGFWIGSPPQKGQGLSAYGQK